MAMSIQNISRVPSFIISPEPALTQTPLNHLPIIAPLARHTESRVSKDSAQARTAATLKAGEELAGPQPQRSEIRRCAQTDMVPWSEPFFRTCSASRVPLASPGELPFWHHKYLWPDLSAGTHGPVARVCSPKGAGYNVRDSIEVSSTKPPSSG